MKLPKGIVIGGLPFRIKTGAAANHTANVSATASVDGLSEFRKQAIFIAKDAAPGYRRILLLHEILHMVLAATGSSMDEATEESFVDGTAGELLNVLRANPEVLLFLIEGIDV